MPTFNEQKGQGAFQPVLSDPAAAGGGGGRTVPGPALSAASTAVSGAADILQTLASRPLDKEHDSQNLIDNKANLEALIAGEASLIAGQGISGGVIPGAKQDVAKVSAAYRQGRISRNEMNVRLASIVQHFVSNDPRNAEEYRDIAREAIGYQPSAQIIADRLSDVQFETDRQRAQRGSAANHALEEYGYGVYEEDGSVNFEATAAAGMKFRQQEAEMRLLKQKADLLKTQAEAKKSGKLSESEIQRAEYTALNDSTRFVLDAHVEAAFNAVSGVRDKLIDAGVADDEIRATIQQDLNERRAIVENTIRRVALDNGISREATDDLVSQYTSTFDSSTALLTGERSEWAKNQQLFEQANARTAAEIQALAPGISAFNSLSPELASSVVNTAIQFQPDVARNFNTTVAQEAAKVVNSVASITTGSGNVNSLADVATVDRPATAQGLLSLSDRAVRRPQMATQQDREAALTAQARLIDAAMDISSVQDRSRAAQRMSTQSYLSALDVWRANDDAADEVGAQLRNLNTVAFLESARRTTPDTTREQLGGFVISGGKAKPITFVPTYNPNTQQIEIRDASGSRVRGERIPPFMEREVAKMNNNLNAIVHLRDYGNNELVAYSPEQIKAAYVMTTGNIAIINPESIEIPGGLASFLGLSEQTPVEGLRD